MIWTLNECGLPPRPFSRLCLLKSPPCFASLDDALEWLVRSATADGLQSCQLQGQRIASDETTRRTLP